MRKYKNRKKLGYLVMAMVLFMAVPGNAVFAGEYVELCSEVFSGLDVESIFEQEVIQGTVYLCDFYDVKSAADEESATVISIPSGTTVQLLDTDAGRGKLWYYVKAAVEDVEYYGYVLRDNLAVSNEKLLELEATMPMKYTENNGSNLEVNGVEKFPESYRAALYKLAEKHPNWVFVPYNTGLDWNYVIEQELKEDRSLVGASRGEGWKDGSYGTGWFYASQAAVRYCMDPRNYLDEESIFQFEQLTYNESYHTVEATQNILQSTFMRGIMPGSEITYAQHFTEVGYSQRVSSFHLASRVAQEQGAGTSPLISGTYSGYEGYYNYFNIGASGSTKEEIYESGLSRAKKEGWSSPALSIQGGARILSNSYILRGQDTLYQQKFDIDGSYDGRFWHQYMQNVEAPCSEAKRIARAYKNAGVFHNRFVFKIPVYDNMPDAPCSSPDTGITSAGIYLLEYDEERVVAGLVVSTTQAVDLEYRWLIYDYSSDMWSEAQTWKKKDEYFTWYPPRTGAYLIQAEVRIAGTDNVVTSVIGYNHEVYIKGMCQMPYTGEGGGYLIGVETNRNPNQKLRYELLILDCTLLAEGKDAWIWTTGQCGVSEGNAFWAVWQPQYGYYWTLFRVYDENGNLLDEECYGFENIC